MRQAGAEMAPMLNNVYGVDLKPAVFNVCDALMSECVQRWCRLKCSEEHGLKMAKEAQEEFFAHCGVCESPIEQIALAAMLFGVTSLYDRPRVFMSTSDALWPNSSIAIAPQFKIGRYRLDFLVRLYRDGKVKAIAVECDGQEFHGERDAMDRDAIRDGFLANIGIETRRYTGSSLYRNYVDIQHWISNFAEWEDL